MLRELIHDITANSSLGRHEAKSAHIEVLLKAEDAVGEWSGKMKIHYGCCCGKKMLSTSFNCRDTGSSQEVSRACMQFAFSELFAKADDISKGYVIRVTSNVPEVANAVLFGKHKNIIVIS